VSERADPLEAPLAGQLIGPLFTLVLCWSLGALLWRLWRWARTPQPVPIPLTPAPRTRTGVLGRLAAELFAFRSLFRATRITWLASIAMHYGLLGIALVHARFLMSVLPAWMVPVLQISGWATLATLAGIVVLAARRLLIDRMRWISVPSDHLHLLLLAAIVLSGTALKRLWPTDLHATGLFLRGALSLDWQPLPAQAGLWLHLGLVTLLLAVFPISKLVHGLGILFAPTWNTRAR